MDKGDEEVEADMQLDGDIAGALDDSVAELDNNECMGCNTGNTASDVVTGAERVKKGTPAPVPLPATERKVG